MKTPRDLSLMDAVHAWTFDPRVNSHPVTGLGKAVLMKQRQRLRAAERFVLDDEAVRLVCRLSHEADRLAGWSFLARLPYDTLWIEFSLHVRCDEYEKMGSLNAPFDPEDVSERLGYLLFKDGGGSDARWVCHEFQIVNNQPTCGMFAYVFDPEGDAVVPVKGSDLWRSPTLSLIPGFPRVKAKNSATGVTYEIDPEFMLAGIFEQDAEQHATAPIWFINRSAVIIDPFWNARFGTDKISQHFPTFATELQELRGSLRWLVVLLATINGLPRDVKPAVTRPGKRAVGMNLLPYLQHHNLSIRVPRDNRVVYARRSLDRAARNAQRAWHRVIGHWRVIERGKARDLCRHIPVMVEHGVGMCERCQLLIRWIDSHSRGDPSIGIVDHDAYLIHGHKRQKTSSDDPPEKEPDEDGISP